MNIEIESYTNEEIQIIIDKMNDLSINYKIKDNVITIIDKIDIKTYNYLIDFSKI